MTETNNFNFVRLAAATMVIYGHSFALTRTPGDPFWFQTDIDGFAVKIFFVVSGYLICQSWNHDSSIIRYLIKRCLRIFPGLVVVVTLSVVLLGPALTTLSLRDYMANPATQDYLWNVLLDTRYALPGVFITNPFAAAVNGSLWTLSAEFLMYLLLPFYGWRKLAVCRTVLFPAALTGTLAISYYYTWIAPAETQPIIYGTLLPQVARWAPYFLGGAAVAFWRLERLLRLDVAIMLICLVATIGGPPAASGFAGMLCTPYIVLAFCLAGPRRLLPKQWESDISYGTYLYGFPIQQTVIHLAGNRISPIALFIICLPIIYGCGLLSWLLIEKPALAMKPARSRRAAHV